MLDTHCHIDLYKNPKAILDRCENKGITVFSMTNLPSHFEMGLPFFQNKKTKSLKLKYFTYNTDYLHKVISYYI